MKQIAQITASPVTARADNIDDQAKLALSEAMSFIVEGHEHMGAGSWDGKSTLYDWISGKFPAGFVPTATAVLQRRGYQVMHRKAPLPTPLGVMPTPKNPIVDNFDPDPNRAYQFKAPRILVKHGNGIYRVATGGGKSRIAALCITYIGRKTAFVTTRQVLLYQMGEALEAAGIKVSYVGDGSWDTSGDVVLCMVQTIADRLGAFQPSNPRISPAEKQRELDRWQKRRDECIELCDSIEFLIAEEAHEAGGNSYYEVCKAMRRASYRMALTATPMMRDGESNVRLIAMFGPIRLEVTEEELIDAGILAQPIFKFIRPQMPPTIRRSTNWQKAETLGIVENANRNKHVCAEAIRASRYGLSTLILIKRKKHGKIIHEMLKRYGLNGTYIFGETNSTKRKEALAKLASGEYDYLIGSTILDVGVDVPSIGLLILAGGGKAEVAHRQRIGRALRRKVKMPNFAFVVDFEDCTNKHLIKHAKQRRAIVEATPGFDRGILPKKRDFDFAGLGFQPTRKAA